MKNNPPKQEVNTSQAGKPERIAKVMARRGVCSRRDAESWIEQGRVKVNNTIISTPATLISSTDIVEVDGKILPAKEPTRLWLFHKPKALVTTARDEKNRPTIFDALPKELPRVISVGRLDINTEGLILLTNDGGLARILELPKTGWLRRYRVRVYGKITQVELDDLKKGIEIEGVSYGEVEAKLQSSKGLNHWLEVGIREGKNREIKRIMQHLGLEVSRLIRISYGPFQLRDLPVGEIIEARSKFIRDQLGATLIEEAGCIFPDGANIQKTRLEISSDANDRGRKPALRARGKGISGERNHKEEPTQKKMPWQKNKNKDDKTSNGDNSKKWPSNSKFPKPSSRSSGSLNRKTTKPDTNKNDASKSDQRPQKRFKPKAMSNKFKIDKSPKKNG